MPDSSVTYLLVEKRKYGERQLKQALKYMKILFRYLWRYLVAAVIFFSLLLPVGLVPAPGVSAMCAAFAFIWLLKSISRENNRKLLSQFEKNLLFSTIVILEAVIAPLHAYAVFRQFEIVIAAFAILLLIEVPLAGYMSYRYSDKMLIETRSVNR